MTHMPASLRRPDQVAGSDLPTDAPKGTPAKRLRNSRDIDNFVASKAHSEFKSFLWHWAASIQLVPRSAVHPAPTAYDAALPEVDAAGVPIGRPIVILWDMLRTMRAWTAEIPLEEMSKARFGNGAFRTWHERVAERCSAEFLQPLVALLRTAEAIPATGGGGEGAAADPAEFNEAEYVAELRGYLLDSFGNATRIDYGSGHELHFAVFLFVLTKMGVLTPAVAAAAAEGDNSERKVSANALTRQVVMIIFWGYLDLMREMQRLYRMEPAGSHGVWGLDDFHHIPFVIGAAQLHDSPNFTTATPPTQGAAGSGDDSSTAAGAAAASAATSPSASLDSSMSSPLRRISSTDVPPPTSIVDAPTVDRMRTDFVYYEMIGWIRDHKRGPFHEHSSVLYNVSGLESWGRIANGMMKMFSGEVLCKINITQHLLFGKHFAFDPNASVAIPAANPSPGHLSATGMPPATRFPGKGVPPPTVAPGTMMRPPAA